jgi:hypothetical protein
MAQTKDMAETIEAQVERFAPGFRDIIIAKNTSNTEQLEHSNANLIGGDIAGGANNFIAASVSSHTGAPSIQADRRRPLHLLCVHSPPRRRRSQDVRIPCGTIGTEKHVWQTLRSL